MKRYQICVAPELESIMDRFLEIRHTELSRMEEAVTSNDADTLRMLGHRLKGCGTSYGMPELSALGRDIEEAAKLKNLETASGALARIRDYLENVDITYGEPETP